MAAKKAGLPTLDQLSDIIKDEESAINYLIAKKVLKVPKVCEECDYLVEPCDTSDPTRYRCINKRC